MKPTHDLLSFFGSLSYPTLQMSFLHSFLYAWCNHIRKHLYLVCCIKFARRSAKLFGVPLICTFFNPLSVPKGRMILYSSPILIRLRFSKLMCTYLIWAESERTLQVSWIAFSTIPKYSIFNWLSFWLAATPVSPELTPSESSVTFMTRCRIRYICLRKDDDHRDGIAEVKASLSPAELPTTRIQLSLFKVRRKVLLPYKIDFVSAYTWRFSLSKATAIFFRSGQTKLARSVIDTKALVSLLRHSNQILFRILKTRQQFFFAIISSSIQLTQQASQANWSAGLLPEFSY